MSTTRKSITVEGLDHRGQPFPVASRKGQLLITSGIFGIDSESGNLPDDLEDQVRLMFLQLQRVLHAADGKLEDVVRMTFYVRDQSSRSIINTYWTEAFPDPASRPARHTLSYEHLPANALVQCDAIAMVASNG